jgi:hypothetical protein
MPGEANFPEEIGIVIDIGILEQSVMRPFQLRGRGHAHHEMGHFSLKHVWGQGFGEDCSDSDDIDDTPNAELTC